jgi:hypothetical protein
MDLPRDLRVGLFIDMSVELPVDLPSDLPRDLPGDLPGDLPDDLLEVHMFGFVLNLMNISLMTHAIYSVNKTGIAVG